MIRFIDRCLAWVEVKVLFRSRLEKNFKATFETELKINQICRQLFTIRHKFAATEDLLSLLGKLKVYDGKEDSIPKIINLVTAELFFRKANGEEISLDTAEQQDDQCELFNEKLSEAQREIDSSKTKLAEQNLKDEASKVDDLKAKLEATQKELEALKTSADSAEQKSKEEVSVGTQTSSSKVQAEIKLEKSKKSKSVLKFIKAPKNKLPMSKSEGKLAQTSISEPLPKVNASPIPPPPLGLGKPVFKINGQIPVLKGEPDGLPASNSTESEIRNYILNLGQIKFNQITDQIKNTIIDVQSDPRMVKGLEQEFLYFYNDKDQHILKFGQDEASEKLALLNKAIRKAKADKDRVDELQQSIAAFNNAKQANEKLIDNLNNVNNYITQNINAEFLTFQIEGQANNANQVVYYRDLQIAENMKVGKQFTYDFLISKIADKLTDCNDAAQEYNEGQQKLNYENEIKSLTENFSQFGINNLTRVIQEKTKLNRLIQLQITTLILEKQPTQKVEKPKRQVSAEPKYPASTIPSGLKTTLSVSPVDMLKKFILPTDKKKE